MLRAPAGVHSIVARIDPDEEILESNRENNTRILRVTFDGGQTLRPVRDAASGAIHLQVVGLPGERYQIQRSEDLVEWFDLQVVDVESDGDTTVELPSKARSHQFYRVRPEE